MAILDKFSEVLKSEKISYSDLSGPGAKSEPTNFPCERG